MLDNCKTLVEKKLGWGSSEKWSNSDFEDLSAKISESTGVILSLTTLKRIWGKVKYDSAPAVTTLNALARFLGFDNWRGFRQQQLELNLRSTIQPGIIPEAIIPVTPKKKISPWIPAIAITCCLAFAATISWNFLSSKHSSNTNHATSEAYRFTNKKIISTGVPNSVIFEYDATASPTDSVYIQQSWDNNLQAKVPKTQHLHTSIYYYPGFFQAKLLAGNRVVKQDDLFIQTNGWIALAEQKPVPVYFKKQDALHNGVFGLSLKTLQSEKVGMGPQPTTVYYANVREFDGLETDDFILETAVRNDYWQGAGACQHCEIRILCEGSMISIPLSAKGCVSENNLFCLGKFVRGTENDLSGFGVDFSHFVNLRLEMSQGKATFIINGKQVYQLEGISQHSKIKGIVYRFQGTGSVDRVMLSRSHGGPLYQDEF